MSSSTGLVAGYASYADAAEIGPDATAEAPAAITPAISGSVPCAASIASAVVLPVDKGR